jgi:hypothetical protein
MSPADHQQLLECWHAALDLVVHGYPHKTPGSFELWHRGAEMTLTTFKQLLAKYDPRQTPSALTANNIDRGAN